MKAALVAIAATGCTQYAHTHMHNAPGVIDLAKPPLHENGDPARVDPPTDPGVETLTMFAMPSALVGTGRIDDGQPAGEYSLELRFEHHVDDGMAPFGSTAFAMTVGTPALQVSGTRGAALGATFVEANYRFLLGHIWPIDIGAGPAVYLDDTAFGAQLTVRLPLVAVRGRYMQHDGFEFWGGIQLPIAFLFQRSR
jgi:hypothetical protein